MSSNSTPHTVQWNPLAGEQHVLGILASGIEPVSGAPRITATYAAALNMGLSIQWASEQCLYFAGIRPIPQAVAAQVSLPGGNVTLPIGLDPPVFGDGLDLATSADKVMGSRRTKAGNLLLGPRPAAVLHYAATRRALRRMVYSGKDVTIAASAINLDDRATFVLTPPELGALPAAAFVVIAVIGVAGVMATAWTVVNIHEQVTALAQSEVVVAAKTKLAADLAKLKIAAGQDVEIAPIVESLGKAELRQERWTLPLVIGGTVLGVGGAYAAHRFLR